MIYADNVVETRITDVQILSGTNNKNNIKNDARYMGDNLQISTESLRIFMNLVKLLLSK